MKCWQSCRILSRARHSLVRRLIDPHHRLETARRWPKLGQRGVSETQPTGEASQRNEELRSLRELVIKQAKELQTLKEEVESLRRQRSDQETTTSKPKIKKSVPR
jgi:hypothetical protein